MKLKPIEIKGVYKDRNQIYTENLEITKGIRVYNEKIIKNLGKEYRAWNPYRSKLAAAILNGLTFELKPDSKILYLGAATGTTVSHISDIVKDGTIYAVEISPVSMKKLIQVCEKRQNIIPVLSDANHPDRYSSIVSQADFIYQDISQRNQAEIFISNIKKYLKSDGTGVLMVKARSIDVALKPEKIYEIVCSKLKEQGLNVLKKTDLKPYEKDHAAIIVSNKRY
jgi:fibrillarin-like pre-rRNA processing protein